MRIDDLNRTPVTQGAEKTDQAASKRALEKNPNATAAGDQADVSQLAQALANNDPQRLEQLRLDVQSGNYTVSADAVAKAIIDQHLKE
ncbi:MAG TPA: flagellar biosynthesis anti-sigma factor FlgM [Bryobacteraceae bacterium]|nr:flagellar biosynthesis anti-sigma factor FlgM [Bryobacteraceae bacterium]